MNAIDQKLEVPSDIESVPYLIRRITVDANALQRISVAVYLLIYNLLIT